MEELKGSEEMCRNAVFSWDKKDEGRIKLLLNDLFLRDGHRRKVIPSRNPSNSWPVVLGLMEPN